MIIKINNYNNMNKNLYYNNKQIKTNFNLIIIKKIIKYSNKNQILFLKNSEIKNFKIKNYNYKINN